MKLTSYIKDKFENLAFRSKSQRSKATLLGMLCMLAAGVSFTSCSDDLDVNNGIGADSDEIVIQFAIPDLTSILTRGIAEDESAIKKLDAYLIDPNGNNEVLVHQSFGSGDVNGNSVTLRVSGEHKDKDVIIYLVANGDDGVANVSDLEALRSYELRQPIDINDGLPMIGYQEVNTSATSASLSLTRSVAKVSASCDVEGAELLGINVYSNSAYGFLASPLNSNSDYPTCIFHSTKNTNTPADDDNGTFGEKKLVYSYPSKGFNYKEEGGAYVIIKVNNNDKDQYYRLNLRREKTAADGKDAGYVDEKSGLLYFDLLANHHYQIEITGFLTDGYATAWEASKHPEEDQNVQYVIHDHAAEVLSMVTDGCHELGVTPNVTLQTLESEETIVVKCYDTTGSDYIKFVPNNAAYEDLTIISKSDWLTVTPNGTHNFDDDFHKDWDEDNPGKQFEFIVQINSSATQVDDTGEIIFSWMGLTRKVEVTYDAAFLLAEVCEVDLTIHDKDSNKDYIINDYWTFVRSLGTLKAREGKTPKLWGILSEDMTGAKKRNGGFHFPMPYGNTANWEYTYKVNFQKLIDLNHKTGISDVVITVNAQDANATIFNDKTIDWTYTPGSIEGTLSFKGDKDSYQYAGGTIAFKVTYSDGESATVDASLYHTGFFNYESNDGKDKQYVNPNDVGYYYYEVVPMGDTGDYWLDRNIGAKSNVSYIDINDPNSVEGRDASGRYYSIVTQKGEFKLPDIDSNICPPGYHIPNTSEWDKVRLHQNFITRSVIYSGTTYMATYYSCGGKIGNIFLQKVRFVNGSNLYENNVRYTMEPNNGDTGAGYYWSVSEAPAMEKEQMGNWVRALYLNGSSSTYVNASLVDHRMPVRCKAGASVENEKVSDHYISFNVHEATHVYLFEWDDEQNQSPLYTFPGRAIGNTASAVKWQNFYCSTNVDPKKLRMLFVKLEQDGKVTIYTKNGNSFESWVSYEKRFLSNKDLSWDVVNGKYYDFCTAGKNRSNNVVESQPGDCITQSDWTNIPENPGGGSGGGGGTLDDNFSWEGWMEFSWGGNVWEEWKGTKDWSGLTAPCTITLILNIYWEGSSTIQLYNGNWGKIPGYENDIKPGPTGDNKPYNIVLNEEQLNNIKQNNGIIIQGDNYGLRKVYISQ